MSRMKLTTKTMIGQYSIGGDRMARVNGYRSSFKFYHYSCSRPVKCCSICWTTTNVRSSVWRMKV